MLENTLNQPYLALVLFTGGLAVGAALIFVRIFRLITAGKQKWSLTRIILDFIATMAAGGICFLINYFLADGKINVFAVAVYLAGMLLSFNIVKLFTDKIIAFFKKRFGEHTSLKRKVHKKTSE